MTQNARKKEISQDDLQAEYVVGGGRGYYSAEILTGNAFDGDLEFSRDTQKRMRRDSEIEASVELLVDSVFSDGIEPIPALTDKDNPEYEEASKIAEFCKTAVSTGTRTLEAVLRELFRDAYYQAFKVGEIVLKPDADSNYVIDRINLKPNEAIGFVCDKFYNVLGLVGATDSGGVPSSLLLDKQKIIEREKFIILTFELENNDPRGVAKIRAAFESWCDKKITREQWKEWRRTSAIPKKWGMTAQGAKDVILKNADNTPKVKDGVPQTETAQTNMMRALEGFANNSTVVFPFGAQGGQLEVSGTGQQFTNALKFNNSEIRKAVLGDSVSTGEDDKGIKSAKQVAMNVVDLRVHSFRNAVADTVERDIFRLLTIVNFGAEKAHLTPRASLGDTERRDWATDLGAAAHAGYQFAPEHLPELDVQFGQKPRKEQTGQNADTSQNTDKTGANNQQ